MRQPNATQQTRWIRAEPLISRTDASFIEVAIWSLAGLALSLFAIANGLFAAVPMILLGE